jgi:hypothetical protein
MPAPADPQAAFRELLLTVVGGAFNAAGYHLEQKPLQWAGGQYRFTRHTPDLPAQSIGFQYLVYHDTEWSSGQPSRFRVMLYPAGRPPKDLSELVVRDFGVAILPSERHWWTHALHNVTELGRALGEAGSLAVAYGMPWMDGTLQP